MSEIQGPSFDTRGQLGLFSVKLFQQLLLGFSIFLLKRSVVYLLPEVLQPLIVRPTALVNTVYPEIVALRPRPPLQLEILTAEIYRVGTLVWWVWVSHISGSN
uniref:Uncharacterized protein n=1 Tax=Cacopsylla melanoneura TaxID=428564 RepID=A0A8D8SUC7_9HEMI